MAADQGSAAPVRRGRPGYDLTRLLDVAVEVFNERGYDGTGHCVADGRTFGVRRRPGTAHVAG